MHRIDNSIGHFLGQRSISQDDVFGNGVFIECSTVARSKSLSFHLVGGIRFPMWDMGTEVGFLLDVKEEIPTVEEEK